MFVQFTIIFDCVASPSEKGYGTVNESPEAITLSYEISSNTVEIPGMKPSAHIELNAVKFKEAGLWNVLKAIEDALFGTDTEDSRFLTVDELIELYKLEMYIRDSSNNTILDSNGNPIQSSVYA